MGYSNFKKDLERSKSVNINKVYNEIIQQEFSNATLDLCVSLEEERSGIDGYIRIKNRHASVQFKVLYGETSWFNASFLPFEISTSFDNWRTVKDGWVYHTNADYFIYIRATPDQTDFVYYIYNTKQLLDIVKGIVSISDTDDIRKNKQNTAKLLNVYLTDIKAAEV